MFFSRQRQPRRGDGHAEMTGPDANGACGAAIGETAVCGPAARWLVAAGAAVGVIVGLAALDPRFILGSGGRWLRPDNDFNAYLVAWHYFVLDRWRLPLFSIPAMGYPEGGSVLFNDALPLTALLTKLLFKASGLLINPYGWWIFATYVLQGAMASRIARALGARSILAAVGAAIFAVCSVPFTSRWFHTALSGHFLVLWAIALYFESEARQRLPMRQLLLIGVVAILVNPYLFVIVALISAATVLERWVKVRPGWREVVWIGLSVAVVAGIAIVSGYGVMITDPVAMKSVGFGLYSWNPASLLVPRRTMWGFGRYFVRDATGGQYEGDTYIGLGALLLLAVSLASRPQWFLAAVRRHPVFVVTLTGLAIWAASSRVYVGSTLVLAIDLSPRMQDIANYFRASGRFIWPLAYTLMLVPLAVIHRQWRPRMAVPLTLLAITLQLVEAAPLVTGLRAATSTILPTLLDATQLSTWVGAHQRVWQYPSWACGGLTGEPAVWGGVATNRELQLELLIARHGVPSNSIYTSRILKDCNKERAWIRNTPQLEEGVLYLLAPKTVAASPALGALTATGSCITLNWVVACSRLWSSPTDLAGRRPGDTR
jgi:Family of unknown function (DUF6311)